MSPPKDYFYTAIPIRLDLVSWIIATTVIIRAAPYDPGAMILGLSTYSGLLADAHVICCLIAGIAVALRIFCKFRYKQGVRIDDWCIVVALLFYYTAVGVAIHASIMTFGKLSESDMKKMMDRELSRFNQVLPRYRRLIFWALAPAAFAQFACKMSILLFYRHIFFISDRYRLVSLFLMIFTVIWFITIVVVVLFICRPSLNFWDDKGTSVSQCVHWEAFAYSMLIVDMAIDVFILVLPIRTAMKLQLPRKNRIAVAGIFALGGFVVITNVIRLVFMHLHVDDGEILFNKSELWTSIHLATAILCACMPIYKSLWNSISTRFGQSWFRVFNKVSPCSSSNKRQSGASCHILEQLEPEQAPPRNTKLPWNINTVSGAAGTPLQGHLLYP